MFFLFCYIKVTKSQTKPLTSSSPLSKSQKTKLTLSAELYLYFDCHITVIMVGWRGGLNRRVISSVIRRSEWGYHDNLTTHLFFWFCNKKQLNFGHFNTSGKNFFERVNFLRKEAKAAPKRPILFCLVYQGVFGHFTTIPDYFRRSPKTTYDSRRLLKISED